MAKSKRILVNFEVTYFTLKGRCFFFTRFVYKCVANNVLLSVAAHIRGLANDDPQHSSLPGFDGDYWEGPILIEDTEGVYGPVIVFPEKRGKNYRAKGLKAAFR